MAFLNPRNRYDLRFEGKYQWPYRWVAAQELSWSRRNHRPAFSRSRFPNPWTNRNWPLRGQYRYFYFLSSNLDPYRTETRWKLRVSSALPFKKSWMGLDNSLVRVLFRIRVRPWTMTTTTFWIIFFNYNFYSVSDLGQWRRWLSG